MSFKSILMESKNEPIIETKVISKPVKIEEKKSAEEILRGNNFKIKSIFGTKFGTEYLMAKKYDEDKIKELLSDFKIKIDDNSIFVVN